jgi:hypothetical protein
VRAANDTVARALETVTTAEIEVEGWNELVKSKLTNIALFASYVIERNKANERLNIVIHKILLPWFTRLSPAY